MGSVNLQPAYVLHQRPYRESSLLLEVFSRDYGRLGLVARAAKRARSPWRGLLQQFRQLLLSWSGRGELMTLAGAELADSGPSLTGRGLLSGFYLNELLMRLVQRNDPHPTLFEAYRSALVGLVAAGREEAVLPGVERGATENRDVSLDLHRARVEQTQVLKVDRCRRQEGCDADDRWRQTVGCFRRPVHGRKMRVGAGSIVALCVRPPEPWRNRNFRSRRT